MKIVIDKDFNERKMLNESYENNRPTYVVKAINESDKFVYAKGLKTINEAVNAVYDLAYESTFDDCSAEIVEVVESKENVIWSYENGLVVEADENKGGFWSKLGDKAKKALDGLKKGISVVGAITKQFSKDMLKKWREAGYFNKQGYITGLGYKVMKGEVKNTIPVDTGDDKTQDISKVWASAQSNVIQALKKQGIVVNGEITAIVKNDKDAILLSANVKTKDGDEQTLTLDQDGNTVDGDGNAVNPENGGGDANGGGNSANTQKITPEQAQKNPKAALGNLATRVANLEKEVGLASESTPKWNFNDEKMVDRPSMERLAISTFFKQLNESNVGSIVFVDQNGKKKTYDVKDGSKSYSEFKKDFRESTASVKNGVEFKLKVESTNDDIKGWNGYNYSDFGSTEWMSRINESTTKRVVTFKATVDENVKKKVTNESSNNESTSKFKVGDKVKVSCDKCASNGWKGEVKSIDGKSKNWGIKVQFPSGKYSSDSGEYSEDELEKVDESTSVVKESFELDDMTQIDAAGQMKSLLDSMRKFDFSQDAKVEDKVVDQTKVGEEEIIKEAEGDEDDAGGDDAGGDADPFVDAGGDEGGDASADADPFADDAAGDDAGGDAEGGDADPFADDAGGGDAGEGDAGAEGGESEATPAAGAQAASGEPAPDSAINTDAQGNPKSQYNINVTKPFNVMDDFSLNEDEQKEFFGKIDQLVKIPDMDNYALYLYQITPENLNLDDVHYITALYDLSVKLGLLEDVYADSNLLNKYNSYKYSVIKNGEEGGELEIQESKYRLFESKKTKSANTKSKVQKDNEEKTDVDKVDSERRGPENTKLNKDENGADKPIVIDANEYGWENKNKKLFGSSEEGDFHGLGWVVTFKAMQFGSPRFMSMYIKKNGDEKAETQCKNYLEKLSYSDIEIVNIEEIDPYEYVYRNSASGMKSVEEIQTSRFANKDIPFMENTSSLPKDIQRDIKGVITKLNAEIRNTKQFNFLRECGIEKPQIDNKEFISGYTTAKVDETVGDTTYKFVFKKNDSCLSRMFYSNMKEKLFKYLGTFAQKFNLDCGCEETQNAIIIDFMRSELNNPMGYDLDTMVNTNDTLPEVQAM